MVHSYCYTQYVRTYVLISTKGSPHQARTWVCRYIFCSVHNSIIGGHPLVSLIKMAASPGLYTHAGHNYTIEHLITLKWGFKAAKWAKCMCGKVHPHSQSMHAGVHCHKDLHTYIWIKLFGEKLSLRPCNNHTEGWVISSKVVIHSSNLVSSFLQNEFILGDSVMHQASIPEVQISPQRSHHGYDGSRKWGHSEVIGWLVKGDISIGRYLN